MPQFRKGFTENLSHNATERKVFEYNQRSRIKYYQRPLLSTLGKKGN